MYFFVTFRYHVNYMGSIESSYYKGNVVLCQAVSTLTARMKARQSLGDCNGSANHLPANPLPVTLEISDKGIKVTRDYMKIQRPCKMFWQ